MDDKLYELMKDLGSSRGSESFLRLRDTGHATSTSPGSALLARGVEGVKAELDAFLRIPSRRKQGALDEPSTSMRTRDLIRDVGSLRAAAVALKTVLDRCSSLADDPIQVAPLQNFIGARLRDEMECLHLSRLHPSRYGFVRRQLVEASAHVRRKIVNRIKTQGKDGEVLEIPAWDRADEKLIGGYVLDMIFKATDLFRIEQRYVFSSQRKKSAKGPPIKSVVLLSDEAQAWMLDVSQRMSHASYSPLPITRLPADWGPTEVGGYHQPVPGQMSIMGGRVRPSQETLWKNFEAPEVFKALNTVQRTAWRVNRRVHEVMHLAAKNGWEGVGLPPISPERPRKPQVEWSRESPDWQEYKRQMTRFRHLDDNYMRDHLRAARMFAVSDILVDFDRFHFPHHYDFRGRAYPIGAALHYQGPDEQRGLLEFADGKRIESRESLRWLRIHGANCWGEDKVPFDAREDWVQTNTPMILAIDEDPIAHREWLEADKPIQFLAWCFDYASFLRNPEGHKSHLPVAMDGSNNGLQVYALLLRDEECGEATNCTPSDSPQDIYQRVADRATERLHEFAKGSDAKLVRWAKEVLRFCGTLGHEGLPREATKKPVMTLPYGSTLYACQNSLCSWYHDYVRGKNLSKDEAPFPEGDSYKVFTWVGTLIWDSIADVVGLPIVAMQWMHSIVGICSEHNIQASWMTPLGHNVIQAYNKGKTRKLTLKACGRPVRVRVWEPIKGVDGKKATQSLPPNFIHSLDAAAMQTTVNAAAMEGVTHFQMIHDSFGTHAADAPTMARVLRESYQALFADTNLLESLRQDIQKLLPEGVELPAPPKQGNLDVNLLTESDYFFA